MAVFSGIYLILNFTNTTEKYSSCDIKSLSIVQVGALTVISFCIQWISQTTMSFRKLKMTHYSGIRINDHWIHTHSLDSYRHIKLVNGGGVSLTWRTLDHRGSKTFVQQKTDQQNHKLTDKICKHHVVSFELRSTKSR